MRRADGVVCAGRNGPDRAEVAGEFSGDDGISRINISVDFGKH